MSHDNNKYLGLCSGLLVNTIMASSSLLRWTFNCLLAVCLIASFCQFLMLVYFTDIISLCIIFLYSLQVISSNTVERQPESLIIGKRKPSLEFQFQNKFRLGGEILPRARSNNVIVRGKMIGGGVAGGLGGTANNRYKPRQASRHSYSASMSPVCDPCTDYLNNPMFHSLHSR